MIRPTTIPETLDELKIEQAIAREALRLSFIQHRTFAVKLHGAQQARSIADAFAQGGSDSLVDLMKLDLLVGSGGVLSHAPRRAQSMLMMIDAFLVEGVTEIAVDSIFMMPHLGVLSTIHPAAATEVFEKDCLVRLGTCVAPVGQAWDLAQARHPGLALHAGDGNHAVPAGSFLTALVIASAITGKLPQDTPPLAQFGVDANTQAALRAVATETVQTISPRLHCPADRLVGQS